MLPVREGFFSMQVYSQPAEKRFSICMLSKEKKKEKEKMSKVYLLVRNGVKWEEGILLEVRG